MACSATHDALGPGGRRLHAARRHGSREPRARRYLALSGREVHLVAHRVWPDLASLPGVTVHHAPRPFGSHLLGAPLLARDRVADRAPSRARRRDCCRTAATRAGSRRRGCTTCTPPMRRRSRRDPRAARRPRPDGAGILAQRSRAIAQRAGDHLQQRADGRRRAPLLRRRRRARPGRLLRRRSGRIRRRDRGRAAPRAQALGLARGRPLALFIGALGDRRKGFDVLFDAWRRSARTPRGTSTSSVVGVGAEAEAWERAPAPPGSRPRITFLRFRSDVARILAAADVLVHPARYEAYGLACTRPCAAACRRSSRRAPAWPSACPTICVR